MGTAEDREALTRDLMWQVLRLLGRQADAAPRGLLVTDRPLGPGYGLTTKEVIEAVERTAQLEGLLLDRVYTGKAMAALFDLVRRKHFKASDQVVFWHTGGHGLGLAIVQAIARAHGATLTPRAQPEGGLDVEVTFPGKPASAPAAPPAP